MNLFTAPARAFQSLPLTPVERAWLRLLQGGFWTALVAALGVFGSFLASGQPWNTVTLTATATAAFLAFCNAYGKYISAKGDGPMAPIIGSAIASEGASIAARFPGQPNAVKVLGPDVAPAPVVAPSSSTSATPSEAPSASETPAAS